MPVDKEVCGNDEEEFLVNYWDRNMKFSGSADLSTYNVGLDRLPSLSRFGSEGFSDIVSSFGLPENTQIEEFPSTNDHAVENLKEKKRKKSSECGDQSVEVEEQNDISSKISKGSIDKDEKKQKNEVNPSVKGNGDVLKEEFVHVRAKRGQSTNSHSLAERVRREKISERMKLLQDLVPGCNKIAGKAVMLDEIINYVQSLQKQVEFLSMRLATVNPEFDLDIEQIFSTENAHLRYGSSPSFEYSHPQLQTELQNSRDILRIATNPQISSMAQLAKSWDNEFLHSQPF